MLCNSKTKTVQDMYDYIKPPTTNTPPLHSLNRCWRLSCWFWILSGIEFIDPSAALSLCSSVS